MVLLERVFPRHLTWPHLLEGGLGGQGELRVGFVPKGGGLMSLSWMWAPCRAALAVVALQVSWAAGAGAPAVKGGQSITLCSPLLSTPLPLSISVGLAESWAGSGIWHKSTGQCCAWWH